MKRQLFASALGIVLLAAFIAARQAPPPQAMFRSGIDLFQLDVTVIDKDRVPVKGLTAADFTVLEDGKARRVVTFKEINVAPVVQSETAWIRDVPPDVISNDRAQGRVVVIVIDDASFQPVESEGTAPIMDVIGIKKVRDAAKAAIGQLGPDDLAAIVYTENNFNTEDFTKDHRRLLASIDQAALVPSTNANSTPVPEGASARPEGGIGGNCMCGLCSLETLGHIAASLGTLKQERKTIVYISAGLPVKHGEADSALRGDGIGSPFTALVEGCAIRRSTEMANVFRQTQRANVTIQAFDPRGIMTDGGLRTEFLRTMAETTGGRAIVNNNTPEQLVPAVFAESSSYYLLGFESGSPPTDGKFHSLKVQVNRPGLDVLARNGFYAPTDKEQKAVAKKSAPAGSAQAAIAGPLPATDLALALSLLPFRGSNDKPEVAVVVGVTEPNDVRTGTAARTQQLDLVEGVFGPSGNSVATQRQSLSFVVSPSASDQIYYEAMARLPMSKGRYSLRVGARAGTGRIGSVYAPVDVPDFANDVLSLSGIFVSVTPAARTAPKDALKNVVPDAPTARRTFGRKDEATAFVKIYQGRSRTLTPTVVTYTITDSGNRTLVGNRTIEAAAFLRTRSVDHEVYLPLAVIAPGRYLLTITAKAGSATAERTAIFSVQ